MNRYTNKGIFGRIRSMKQMRETVLTLNEFLNQEELDLQDRIDSVKHGVERSVFFKFAGEKMFGCNLESINKENVMYWQPIRNMVDECIEDGFITVDVQEVTGSHNEMGCSSECIRKKGHYLLISSKGKKLMRNGYYIFHFIPTAFPQPYGFILSIVSAVVVAFVTTIITISVL